MNILLVVVDTLRRDAISVYDSEWETPHLDRIANDCIVFEEATASSCWTMPTHSSMFTGLYPSHHRAMEPLVYLPDDTPLISESLQSAGYGTHAINIPHPLSGNAGFKRGWDEFQNTYAEPKYKQAAHLLSSWINIGLRNEPFEAIQPGYIASLRKNYRTRRAVNNVAERFNRGGDRFVFTNLFSAHADYKPLPRHAPEVSSEAHKLSEITRSSSGHYYRTRFNYSNLEKDLPDDVIDECRELYQAEVSWIDSNLGRLWEQLKHDGNLNNTMVIITADHGELFGESEEISLDHRNSLHPTLIDVPLLLYHPDIDPKRDDRLVSHTDIAPTILDAAGLTPDWEMDGISLLSSEEHKLVFAEHGPNEMSEEYLEDNWDVDLTPYIIERKVARTKEATVRFRSDGSVRKHNRVAPDEAVPDEEVERLRARVEEELIWMGEQEQDPDEISEDVREQLKNVGYLG